jgi:hypothetical protein
MPRTKPSAAPPTPKDGPVPAIDTTLPAGTRREDVLADEESMRDTPLDAATPPSGTEGAERGDRET